MSPRELAEEAREALRRRPRGTAEEEIQRLVDAGIIKLLGNGKVKVLFGEDKAKTEARPKKKRKKGRKPTE